MYCVFPTKDHTEKEKFRMQHRQQNALIESLGNNIISSYSPDKATYFDQWSQQRSNL